MTPSQQPLIACITDIGIKRTSNQDSYFTAHLADNESNEWLVLAVGDGMGGLADGELASSETMKAIREFFLTPDLEISNLKELLPEFLQTVNEKVYRLSPNQKGTTCTVAVLSKTQCEVFHVGDSRAYQSLSDGTLIQLTKDHSWFQKLVDEGIEVPAQEKSKKQSTLTNALGARMQPIIVDYVCVDLNPGDRVLVASDGFWHHLEEIGFEGFVPDRLKGFEGLKRVVEGSIAFGETDNLTAVVGGW